MALASSAFAGDISGHWQRGDGQAKVKIAPCGSSLCAVNTWIKNKAGDEKVGDRLVFSVKPTASGTLEGKAYDPQRDMNYKLKISIGDDNQKMTTRGCVLLGMVCKSMRWTRLK